MKKFLIAVIFNCAGRFSRLLYCQNAGARYQNNNGTSSGLCRMTRWTASASALAEKYGDTRSYKEISWYAQKKNNIERYIYPGQKLYIDLEVPAAESK